MWNVLSTNLKLSTHLDCDLQITKAQYKSRQTFPRGRPREFRNPVEKVDMEYPKLYYSNVCGPLIDIIYTVH